jgi:hypothetical protein
MNVGQSVEWELAGETEIRGENLCPLSTIKSTCDGSCVQGLELAPSDIKKVKIVPVLN